MIYDISYKTLTDPKILSIRFNQVDGFVSVYDGNIYLVLFSLEKYDPFYNRIRYQKGVKSGITYVFSHHYVKIKIDSYDSLPLEKILILDIVIILINSVVTKDQSHHYCNIYLEKCSYQLAKK